MKKDVEKAYYEIKTDEKAIKTKYVETVGNKRKYIIKKLSVGIPYNLTGYAIDQYGVVYESSVIDSFKDVRILLVEDNELNREIATELLKSVGFILDEAENGSQAVQMVNDSPAGYYKVILMDVMMPVMNGYESTKKIRSLEDKAKANVPIIAMTANAFEEDKNQAIECGMDKFVSKPFDINDLLVKLKEMIDMKVHSPRSGD